MNIDRAHPWGSLHFPPSLRLTALRQGLAGPETVRTTRPVKRTCVFYDTVEWSLWFSDLLLVRSGDAIDLAVRDHGWPGAIQLRVEGMETVPRRAAEWPSATFGHALSRLIGLRALMPIAEVTVEERTVELLNLDGKVIFRFGLLNLFEHGRQRVPFFRLCRPMPLRGYDHEAATAMTRMQELGLAATDAGPLHLVLAGQGQEPRPFTLRPVFDLAPGATTREAVRQIVSRMLTLARNQEAGLIDDLDTEFLHDYRICLRKVRSLIAQMKDVYPPEEAARLQQVCGDLARISNRLRDLDVYLLDRETYARLLPASLRGGLQELIRTVQEERDQEFRRVRRHLRSAGYRNRMEDLEAFFREPDRLPPSRTSARPIRAFSSQRIMRRYGRIRREGRRVTPTTPDAVMHDLRIQCKMLRYLLEFFFELYDPDEVSGLLKHLRRLQNRLGRFNDYAVQQDSLLTYWNQLGASSSPEIALAIGGLVAALHDRQQIERERVRKALVRFCTREVRERFRKVFAPPGNPDA